MDIPQLKVELSGEARRLGFAACGVTSVRPFTEARDRALAAIDAGRMDGMPWYTRERVEASADIGARYPWARSIIALAWPYRPAPVPVEHRDPDGDRPRPFLRLRVHGRWTGEPSTITTSSRSAATCVVELASRAVEDVRAKRFVDHGWALDRAIAERAGIGFAGKHASVITLEAGSYVLLAAIAVSIPFAEDAPSQRGCGSCSACIPSCPTGAIVAPGRHRRPALHLVPDHRASRRDFRRIAPA